MKTIDRYLLREFLVPLGYCLFAFLLIMIVYDLFDNLSTFIKWGTPFWEVVGYYLAITPSHISITLPMSMLLALLYCLAMFARHQELIAMRASGMSLRRLMLPYLGVGVAGSLVLFFMNERIVPHAVDRAQQFMNQKKAEYQQEKNAKQENASKAEEPHAVRWGRKQLASALLFYNARDHRHWVVQEFSREEKEVRNVEILQLDGNGRELWKLVAARGEYLDGEWWFFDAKMIDLQTLRTIKDSERLRLEELTESPKLLATMLKQPDQMTIKELRNYLSVHRTSDAEDLAPFYVNLHQRFAQPWMCLVMVLLAITMGTRVGRRGPLVSVASSLGLFFAYWLVAQISFGLGQNSYIDPWIAAWAPNTLFGVVGLAGYLFIR